MTGPVGSTINAPASRQRRRAGRRRVWLVLITALATAYVGAIGLLSFVTVKAVAPEVRKAIHSLQDSRSYVKENDVARLLGNLPRYPDARLNEVATNNPALRLFADHLGSSSSVILVFDSDDPIERVTEWYGNVLRHWRRVDVLEDLRLPLTLPNRQTAAFARGEEFVILFPGIGRPARSSDKSHFVLMYSSRSIAVASFERLKRDVETKPHDIDLRRRLAFIYEQMMDYEKAVSHWKQIVARPASDASAYHRLGLVLSRLCRREEALKWIQAALSQSQRIASLNARAQNTKALSLQERTVALVDAGLILQNMGRPKEAEDMFFKAAISEPQSPLPRFRLAVLYHEDGRLNDAIEEYDLAMKLGSEQAWTGYLRAEIETGDSPHAEQLLDEARRRGGFLRYYRRDQSHGHRQPWIGVQMQSMSDRWASALGVPVRGGIWLEEVIPGSPAFRAGMRRQDVIYEVEGKPILRSIDLVQTMQSRAPGDVIHFMVWRNRSPAKIVATIGTMLD